MPPPSAPASAPVWAAPPGATIHTVGKGETLWAISKRYGVELHDLTRANRIQDVSQVEVGQRLVIPERRRRAKAFSAARTLPDSGDFSWPVDGRVISLFGMRRSGSINKGVDIQAPTGSEVRATRSGRVSFVHEAMPGFGKTIILEHSEGFASVYAYVDQILVSAGEQVPQGRVIARVGDTGRTQVPALHFEIRRYQKPQNPLHYLP